MSMARLQQGLSLTLVFLALGWAGWCLHVGLGGHALWALVLLLPQAPILGLELMWAAWAARRDGARRPLGQSACAPEPFPGWTVWSRAWLQELWASVQTFGWRQPWAYRRWPDHLPRPARGRRGVLLVHGFACNRGFWNPWMKRLRAAGVPHVAVTMEPPTADIAVQALGLQEAWDRMMAATGVPPLLVGHSMGGLAIRSWLALQPEDLAVQHEVITIGSPHHGTALAMMARSEAGTQMQLLSPFIMSLAERESAARRARFTCYWSVCDNIVFPASTATLPGADNRAVQGRPHVALAHAPIVLADVLTRTAPGGALGDAHADAACRSL
ncbi:MAG: permease [Betaproteobacteria bacterium]|nr:permease [Betaproteobacteria bacterium]NBT11307.1 permease [Betaproteobacteria bacterium]NBU48695.1 permease [Betaproteobacteria bacterium]NBX96649.1 permease [Betaproteobacteria bacterium]